MKYPVRFFVIILITICTSILKAEEALEKLPKIVYINMNKVMNETSAGKSLINQLEKIHKSNIGEFKKIEEELKAEESLILSQKNIISQDEYKNKVNLFDKKLNDYKKQRKEKIEAVAKKKAEATSKLLKEITPILTEYSEKNNISIILRKEDLVIARSHLEITNEIIKIVNSKVKKININ